MFQKSRTEDQKLIKKQWNSVGKERQVECQTLFWSIKIRALTIVHQLMAMCTLKNEEGEKLYKNQIAAVKEKIDQIIKKIRKQQKTLEALGRDILGITDKEIKDLNK